MKKFFVTEEEAQDQLRDIAGALEGLRFRLLGVRASLEVPPEETVMLLGEMDMDVSTEVRTTVECVLNDYVEPAIRDLQGAADYVPDAEEKE